MNNRRKFLGQLGLILGIATVPMTLIPKMKPQIYKLKTQWSEELAQDLKAYHGIDAEKELLAIFEREINKEIACEFRNRLVISVYQGPYVVEPLWGLKRYEMYAKVI